MERNYKHIENKNKKIIVNSYNSLVNKADYINYIPNEKLYIVWLLTPEKRFYEEVNKTKYELAVKEMPKNNSNPNCIPYLLYKHHYLEIIGTNISVDVNENTYRFILDEEIPKYNHRLYEKRTYIQEISEEEFKNLPSSINIPEFEIIHRENTKKWDKFLKNELTNLQYNIFSKLFYEEKSKKETAESLGIAQCTLSIHLSSIKNKIKKFYDDIKV